VLFPWQVCLEQDEANIEIKIMIKKKTFFIFMYNNFYFILIKKPLLYDTTVHIKSQELENSENKRENWYNKNYYLLIY